MYTQMTARSNGKDCYIEDMQTSQKIADLHPPKLNIIIAQKKTKKKTKFTIWNRWG